MPILERDPWRLQFFENANCPDDVFIATDDPDGWLLYPDHRWVYDKLRVAESQGLRCGPHGVLPDRYPVFSKPIVNLKGMGIGSRLVTKAAEWDEAHQPGHMWMELLEGPHVSTDCAVLDGRIAWCRHTTGVAWDAGMFKHWIIHARPQPQLEADLASWISAHMRDYCGMLNLETIGGRIIEVHLRFADQWCDLYGPGWVDALIGLYAKGRWDFAEAERTDGFSLPLFAHHGRDFSRPSQETQAAIRRMAHVKSLQITFYETKSAAYHPMPPGGFRLAIINTTDLDAGLSARRELASSFPKDAIQMPD